MSLVTPSQGGGECYSRRDVWTERVCVSSDRRGAPIDHCSVNVSRLVKRLPCTTCSSFDNPREGEGDTLLISVPAPEMVRTVGDLLKRRCVAYRATASTLRVEGTNAAALADDLAVDPSLTEFQLKAIHVLVFDGQGEPAFEFFRNVRTLYRIRVGLDQSHIVECLSNRRVTSHFQPLVDLGSREIVGYEALARGHRPDGGIIPPTELFKFARESDASFFLDRLTRETAIRSAAQLGLEGMLFINFMPNAIYDPKQCLKTTFDVARETGFDPSRIVFEVVETERIGDLGHLANILAYYREQGFRVALDDVGSGYSSLNLLAELRPDIIKVDRDIISGIGSNTMKQSIFRALVVAAGEHGITVLAEGIETEEEADFVTAEGATLGQGYFFAKPSAVPPRILAVH